MLKSHGCSSKSRPTSPTAATPPLPPRRPGTARISRSPSASPARPPHVSYVCVFCPGLQSDEFPLEPRILAMEEDVLLLGIIVSSRREVYEDLDYYIYQAADSAAGGGPSLKRLPRPPEPYGFESTHVGILRCGIKRKERDDQSMFVLRRCDTTVDDFYVVAGLCTACSAKPWHFVLCHYNSKIPTHWSIDNISLNNQQLLQTGCYSHHINSKVIAIGGKAGTMGFVDLWRGILFCDVLNVEGKPIPPLHYVPLPPRHLPSTYCTGDARLSRDIAVVDDEEGRMIKYVELQFLLKPDKGFTGPYAEDGWVTRTYKRPVSATYLEGGWVEDCRCVFSLIPTDNNPHFKHLPTVLDSEGKPMSPFKGLDVRQPTLSLQDDDGTVYFMVKKNREDPKAWVIAVDAREDELHGVAEFAAERIVVVTFAYVHCRISRYLRNATGAQKILKRHGMVLLGSSSKRHQGMSMLDPDIACPTDVVMEDFDMELD